MSTFDDGNRSIKIILDTAIQQLLQSKIDDSPALDAQLLLAHALEKSRSYLFAYPEQPINESQQKLFSELLEKRCQGKPIAYLLQNQAFWSLDFFVNESVLIPRPETELLVEYILSQDAVFDPKQNIILVDAGTGSGAIAISVAHERKAWQVFAVDQSEEAVAVAKNNALKHSCHNVQCMQSDWLASFEQASVDILLSNPPYIADDDPHLQQGDVRFEPESALVANEQGLADIQTLAQQAQYVLKDGGLFACEHGYQQAQAVQNIFQKNNFKKIETLKDLAANDRITLGYLSKK